MAFSAVLGGSLDLGLSTTKSLGRASGGTPMAASLRSGTPLGGVARVPAGEGEAPSL